MGHGLSPTQRKILAFVTENPPADNGSCDWNWDRRPYFGASAQSLSRALRGLEERGLVTRSWSGPNHRGRLRVELVHHTPSEIRSCGSSAAGGEAA